MTQIRKKTRNKINRSFAVFQLNNKKLTTAPVAAILGARQSDLLALLVVVVVVVSCFSVFMSGVARKSWNEKRIFVLKMFKSFRRGELVRRIEPNWEPYR